MTVTVQVLENDRRFLELAGNADERGKMLLAYLEELHNMGAPLPPTAQRVAGDTRIR